MATSEAGAVDAAVPHLTRRSALALSVAAVAVPSLTGTAKAAPASDAQPTTRNTESPRGEALHLIRRATYGPTPGLVAEVTNRGTRAWLERQLRPSSIPDPAGTAIKRMYPEAGWTISDVYRRVHAGQLDRYSWDVMLPLGQYTIAMATWSSRQLHEVMVEFWSNHLNVTNTFDGAWDNRQDYDRTVIRKHALGKFSDMLVASAAHPAMLAYLNQAESTKDAPNENYGRELLELHTVGVDAGYSERMVLDSARIMTGYALEWNEKSSRFRQFHYDPSIHWRGRVRVLGFSHPNSHADGRQVARAYLKYLARHPATARTIAHKLAVRFVSDDPSPALVERLASIYRQHDTSIAPVLRALFTSAEFSASAGQKVRRPYEDLIGALRALNYRPLPSSRGAARQRSGVEALYWISNQLGQAPMAWALPDGYPDVASAWGSAGGLLERWNIHQSLAAAWWPAKDKITVPNLPALLPRPLTTYGALVDALATRLTGEPLPAKDTAAVLTFLGQPAEARVGAKDAAVSWDLARTVGLILHTANHQVR